MKKLAILLVLLTMVAFTTSLVHAQKYEMGGDVAVKVQYFRFMDGSLRDAGAQDGVYVGLEAYKRVCFLPCLPNLYLGMEVGWAGTNGNFSQNIIGVGTFNVETDVNYVPIEFNAKYVFELSPCLFFDLGAGISVNYFNMKFESLGQSASTNDWLFGGQFFGELNYKISPCLFLGIGVKYQITEDVGTFGFNGDAHADNFRAGMQLGYKF